MKNTFQKLGNEFRLIRNSFSLLFLLFSSVFGKHAIAVDVCKDIEIPRGNFIYIADAKFQRLKTTSIPVGHIVFPADISVENKFYAISSRDMIADTLGGGRELDVEIKHIKFKCNKVNVSVINFSFGSSILPAGNFSLELPIFGRKSDGSPGLGAHPIKVEGSILTAWINAGFRSKGEGQAELILTNSGNLAGLPFDTQPIPRDLPFQIEANDCQGTALQPGKSCIIQMKQNAAPSALDWRVTWDVGYEKSVSFFRLILIRESGQLKAYVTNR